ncbi:MAG: cyanophycin synthetase [Candidatus Diapherotrites archaeon]
MTERIRVNGKDISKKEFAEKLSELIPVIKKSKLNPSYFEVLTILAAKVFQEQETEFIILETGLGGRLDATNAFNSQIQVITDISLEHTKHLGNTIAKIAFEKAGIIKKGIAVVRKDNAGYKQIKNKIKKMNAKELNPEKELKKAEYGKIKTNLLGMHQIRNASLAITSVLALKKKYKISIKAIQKGLMKVNWKGRMQIIERKPLTIIDGAHNPAGINNLFHSLTEFTYEKLIVVFGVLADKNWKEMSWEVSKNANELILVKPESHRALEPSELKNFLRRGKIINSFSEALKHAKKIAGKKDLVLICGSLYLIGKALK